MTTKAVVSTAPQTTGIPKSICKAMAPPNISANEVDIEAKTAVAKTGRETHRGVRLFPR